MQSNSDTVNNTPLVLWTTGQTPQLNHGLCYCRWNVKEKLGHTESYIYHIMKHCMAALFCFGDKVAIGDKTGGEIYERQ
jgi:hypothetical protein